MNHQPRIHINDTNVAFNDSSVFAWHGRSGVNLY